MLRWFICPRGSITPEGSGPCPSGYYCTQTMAIPCEAGFYCPGTGNTFPLPCFPGTYSPTSGQSSCTLCGIGFQCPGWKRIAPELCKAGYVCDEEGLASPTKLCPSGFYCGDGTMTDNPNSLNGPLPCPLGAFCLEGVAHNITTRWLPSFEPGRLAPQPCEEGYFCPSNSSRPLPCFPGHYCPVSSAFPTQVPPGT